MPAPMPSKTELRRGLRLLLAENVEELDEHVERKMAMIRKLLDLKAPDIVVRDVVLTLNRVLEVRGLRRGERSHGDAKWTAGKLREIRRRQEAKIRAWAA